MSLLFESIRISGRTLFNLPYHQDRVDRSREALFSNYSPLILKEMIKVPDELDGGEYKCRISYGKEGYEIQITPYIPKQISSLKLMFHNEIDYGYKYEDRKLLTELWKQRKECDDILIVKQGYITDTSYSNIVFWDGEKWITPSTFLLAGTQRARLLSEGHIHQKEIKPSDLKYFKYARLINALLCWESGTNIPIEAIL